MSPEFLSPVSARRYEIDGYQGETLLMLPPADQRLGNGALRFPVFYGARRRARLFGSGRMAIRGTHMSSCSSMGNPCDGGSARETACCVRIRCR